MQRNTGEFLNSKFSFVSMGIENTSNDSTMGGSFDGWMVQTAPVSKSDGTRGTVRFALPLLVSGD